MKIVKLLLSCVGTFLLLFLLESVTFANVYKDVNTQKELQVKEMVKETKMYKVPTELGSNKEEVSKKAKIMFAKEMKIIDEYFKRENINLTNDLNDRNYLDMVLSIGSAIEIFSEQDQDGIRKFVKFIDRFENFEKNERIIELKQSIDNNTLTSNEIQEIEALIPIESHPLMEDSQPLMDSILPENEILPEAVASNGYNNIKARDYAYKWTVNGQTTRNNADYGYYSRRNNCYACWNDCTNFVSQAIFNGGIKQRTGSGTYRDSDAWYYNDTLPSFTWGGAQNFYLHFKARAGMTKSIAALQTGDVVTADFDKDGDMEHAAIITKNWGDNSDQKFLTQHQPDKKELTTIANWKYTNNYDVYGLEIDKASN